MRRETENQRDTRTLEGYPKIKVKDHLLQQRLLPCLASSLREVPMVPNRLSDVPPKRPLPLQSPEQIHRSSQESSRLSPNSTLRVKLGPLHQPKETIRPQPSGPSILKPAFPPQFMKDLNNHSVPSHTRSNQVTESKVILSSLGGENITAQRQESHKQIPCKRPPASENLIPAVDLNHSSPKRCRDTEHRDDIAKKLCRDNENYGNTQKPIVGVSMSTSHLSEPSSGHSSAQTKITDGHRCVESPKFKHSQPSCSSLLPKTCLNKQTTMGVKRAYIKFSQNKAVEISIPNPDKGIWKNGREEKNREVASSSLLSSKVPQKDPHSSMHFQSGSDSSSFGRHNTSVLPAKTWSSDKKMESRKSDSSPAKGASKPNSGSLNCRTPEKKRTVCSRRPAAIPDDISDLFTPDPITSVITPNTKPAKPKPNREAIKSSTTEKTSLSASVASSSNRDMGSLNHKGENTVTGSLQPVGTTDSSLSMAHHPQMSLPSVTLERIRIEDLTSFCPPDSTFQNGSKATSSGGQLQNQSVESDENQTSLHNVRPCTSEIITTQKTSTSHCPPTPSQESQASSVDEKQVNQEDPLDAELDLDLRIALDFNLSQSSSSSEEEQLLSLQEMMECATPVKGSFSEPSTPGHHCSLSKTQLPFAQGIYKNNLDQMLEEINSNKRAKELEKQLLSVCEEDLLRIAEYEKAEENREEAITTEHQEFLQRYLVIPSSINEVPPGEEVFNLDKFGQIFNLDTLQLKKFMFHSQETAQKALHVTSPAQLKLHINIGMFQEVYNSHLPCPSQVTQFLFKMMSVHNERMVSEKILKALCDIACTAAYQRVKNGSLNFNIWVPTLADVTLVLMNMGAAFVGLFPLENLQPPFTEGDLLEGSRIDTESRSNKEQHTFPEHNYNNIWKYLSYCMTLCPRAYSDDELLLLLTVLSRVSLDTQLILKSSVDLYPVLYKIVCNIRDWKAMLPRICLALTHLTDDHHNMCLLVQLLPHNTRGKQLRRHLSLCMISKLLDGNCTYRPTEEEFQLSELRPYLPRMQPSALLRGMRSSSSSTREEKEDMATLDLQAYYLCYSLLTLVNEASNFQFFPAYQKEQLLFLCSELEAHVKCDIRESAKHLYRSKVKDLVARIYTKWQILLQRTKPLNGKLYDYWKPVDLTTQEEQETDSSDDEEGPVMEDDERSSNTEEKDIDMISEDEEKEEGNRPVNDRQEMDDTMPEELQ